MLPGRPLPSEVLTDLSLRCLPLLKIPGSRHIIEALLVCHSCSSATESVHPTFLKAIVESQRNAYSDDGCGKLIIEGPWFTSRYRRFIGVSFM